MNKVFSSFRRTPTREERTYDECHKRLFYTSLRILNNSMEAEEVMHDTLLKYFAREEFGTTRERDSWLTRVCINLSIDRLRKKKSDENLLHSEELKNTLTETDSYEEYTFRGVTVSQVKDVIQTLAEGYRVVLSLVLFEGYDYEEVAQITGLKEVSVRTQYIRGKARIIEELEKRKGRS
jgi:RNA polymerase sigma factor (sigma-70 family)